MLAIRLSGVKYDVAHNVVRAIYIPRKRAPATTLASRQENDRREISEKRDRRIVKMKASMMRLGCVLLLIPLVMLVKEGEGTWLVEIAIGIHRSYYVL